MTTSIQTIFSLKNKKKKKTRHLNTIRAKYSYSDSCDAIEHRMYDIEVAKPHRISLKSHLIVYNWPINVDLARDTVPQT